MDGEIFHERTGTPVLLSKIVHSFVHLSANHRIKE